MIFTKDCDNKVFDYIYPLGETIASLEWAIRASYQHTIMATPGKSVFGRDTIFNLTPVIDWRAITAAKQRQVGIDNI